MTEAKVFRYKFEFSPNGTKVTRQGKSRRGGYFTLSQVRIDGDLRHDAGKASKLAAAMSAPKQLL